MKRVLLLLGLTGCDALFRLSEVQDLPRDSAMDTAIDSAPIDELDAPPTCFGTGLLQNVCPANIQGALSFGDQTINTDTEALCNNHVQGPTMPDLCVIAAASFTVTGQFRAIGTRPLVLAAQGSISIAQTGIIDVSTDTLCTGSLPVGAGANFVKQNAAHRQAALTNGGACGGAGGGFRGGGGDGGNGDPGAPSCPQKAPAKLTALTFVRGGTQGARGGDTINSSNGGGVPGSSGGVIYLIATTQIDVEGRIYAWGGGGCGAKIANTNEAPGGAGGGSGGLIGFDAPAITFGGTSLLLASGGAGGGGGLEANGGSPGSEVSAADPTSPAQGGGGGAQSGGGGLSSSGGQDDGSPGGSYDSVSGGGAGGGGGGAGWIITHGAVTAIGQMVPVAVSQ